METLSPVYRASQEAFGGNAPVCRRTRRRPPDRPSLAPFESRDDVRPPKPGPSGARPGSADAGCCWTPGDDRRTTMTHATLTQRIAAQPPGPPGPIPVAHDERGMIDLYEVLQVDRHAEREVMRAAYRALARKHHPDFGGRAREMALINEAWSVLGDPARRAAYDAEPAASGVTPGRESSPTSTPSADPVARRPPAPSRRPRPGGPATGPAPGHRQGDGLRPLRGLDDRRVGRARSRLSCVARANADRAPDGRRDRRGPGRTRGDRVAAGPAAAAEAPSLPLIGAPPRREARQAAVMAPPRPGWCRPGPDPRHCPG